MNKHITISTTKCSSLDFKEMQSKIPARYLHLTKITEILNRTLPHVRWDAEKLEGTPILTIFEENNPEVNSQRGWINRLDVYVNSHTMECYLVTKWKTARQPTVPLTRPLPEVHCTSLLSDAPNVVNTFARTHS